MKKFLIPLMGGLAGFLNGLFGAGGGVIAVPLLQKAGLDPRRAHATSVAVIFPLSIISICFYFAQGALTAGDALPYLPFGLVGGVVGSRLLKRINADLLRQVFGVLLILSALRMLWS